MHALTLLAACLLLAWSSPAHAQCVSMNNNATHGFTAECAMVLQYSDATIQGGTDDCRVSPNRRIQMLQTLLSLSAVPPACKRAFFKYSCAAVYIPCTGGRVASPCSPLKQIADPSVCPANIYTLVTSSLGLIADQVWPTTQAGITVNDTEEGVQIFSSHAACQNLDDESTVFKADALTTEVDATGTPVVDSVYGQAHGTFYPRCRAYSGSICSAVIPPAAEVYVRAGLSFAQLEGGVALNAKNAFQAVNKFDCLEPMMNAACATAMPRCDQTALALTLGRFRNMPNYDGAVGAMLDGLRPIANAPFPRFAARDLCDKVHAASSRCSPTVVSGLGAASALQFANCAGAVFIKERTCQAGGVIGLSLVPLYPETGNVTLLDLTIPNNLGDDNTLGVVIPANEANDGPYSTYTYDPSVFNDQVECQHPMVKPDDPTYRDENTDGASCVPPCPMFAYTDTEYDRVSVVMWITTLCSFILSTMMVATYALFKRMRKSVYTIYFTCDIFVVSIALFFSVATESPDGDPEHDSPWAHSRCRDNSRPLLTGYCAFQAFAMVFCGGSAVAWWFIQSCDLYLQIAWNAGKWLDDRKRIKDIIYHVWGFGYPALNIIVCASLDKLGNSQVGIAWCFITDSDLAWGIFYGPIGVQTVLGVGFMILIMRAIWRSSQATGSAKKPGWWKIYIRPMLFISCFLIVWAFVFAYRFSESFNEDTYKADGKEFAACLLGGSTEAQCEPLRPRPNLFLWYVVHFMIGSVGIFCFALYGTHTMFIMWFHYLICDKDYNYSRTNDLSTGTGSRGKGSSRNLSRQGSRKGNLSRQGSRKGSRRGLRRGQGSSGSAETTSTSQDGLNYGSKSDKPKKGSVMLSEI